jgi:CBS domain-containing protein
VIHRNLSPEDQAAEVDKVKRSMSGMIVDPITLPPDATLGEAEAIMARYHISGVPITDNGRLVGILTNRDIRFATQPDAPVREFMTSEGLITAPVGTSLEEAKSILQKYRIEKLPLVDEHFNLRGLITYKDILKKQDFPNAAVDSRGRLLVAAAVGVGQDLEHRLEALLDADVDAVAVDTAHGHAEAVLRIEDRCGGGAKKLHGLHEGLRLIFRAGEQPPAVLAFLGQGGEKGEEGQLAVQSRLGDAVPVFLAQGAGNDGPGGKHAQLSQGPGGSGVDDA